MRHNNEYMIWILVPDLNFEGDGKVWAETEWCKRAFENYDREPLLADALEVLARARDYHRKETYKLTLTVGD